MRRKRLLFCFIALSSLLLPLAAGAECSWRSEMTTTNPEIGTSQTTGGCYSTEAMASADKKQSCTDEKPKGGSSGFATTRYICCCPTDEAPVLKAEPPSFDIPEFQVPIPTVELSQPICTSTDNNSYCSVPWIGEYISGIYTYGLNIAGILAALMLMAGGVLWLISGGDASRITQAKELIVGSVTGLILLVGTYIILTQINPDLVNLPPLGIDTTQDYEPLSKEGNQDNSTDCENCVTLDAAIPYKNGNMLNANLSSKLATAWNNSAGLAWRVTEAFPPSSKHKSACHYNGMCADVALTGDKTCVNVTKLITILRNAGLAVLNEYAGCSGTQTTYSTGGHLHVK